MLPTIKLKWNTHLFENVLNLIRMEAFIEVVDSPRICSRNEIPDQHLQY